MVWAMDQVDQSSSDDLGINGNVTPDQKYSANQVTVTSGLHSQLSTSEK